MEMASILFEKMVAGAEIFSPGSLLFLLSAFPLKMIDFGIRHMVDLPACPLHSITPIRFFKKKKIILIQKANLIQNLPFYHHTGTDHRIHFHRFRIISLLSWKSSREQPPQETLVEQLCRKGWKIGDR